MARLVTYNFLKERMFNVLADLERDVVEMAKEIFKTNKVRARELVGDDLATMGITAITSGASFNKDTWEWTLVAGDNEFKITTKGTILPLVIYGVQILTAGSKIVREISFKIRDTLRPKIPLYPAWVDEKGIGVFYGVNPETMEDVVAAIIEKDPDVEITIRLHAEAAGTEKLRLLGFVGERVE